MKKIKIFGIICIISLILLPLFSWNVKAIKIENTSYPVEIGDSLIYKIIDGSNTDYIGNKYKYTIENVYRGNSSLLGPIASTWMGAIINVSLESYNKSTDTWSFGPFGKEIFPVLAYNETTKDFKGSHQWLFALPIPMNLSFIAIYIENLELGTSNKENFTVKLSNNALNITHYIWKSESLVWEDIFLYTYSNQGIATRVEQISITGGTFMIMELETDEESKVPLIPFGITFIGFTCFSIIAFAIIVNRKIKLKL